LPEKKAKRLLKDVEILFISLVDQAANKRTIVWKSKNEHSPTLEREIPIIKVDEEKHIVYGIVYAPEDVDTQGDMMTADEIEKMAYRFMKARRTTNVDEQHDYDPDEGYVAESWLIRAGDPLFPNEKEGAWAVGIKVENEETWEKVKKGEITGLSMGGYGKAIELEDDTGVEKSVVPYKAYPVVEGKWDKNAAIKRLRAWASSDGSGDKDTIDWKKYRQGFAWYDKNDPENFTSYKLPHHDVEDGKLVTVRNGVFSAAGALEGARGGVDIPEEDMPGVRSHIAKHYHQMDLKAPWETEKSGIWDKMRKTLTKIFLGDNMIRKDFNEEFKRNSINQAIWALQDALNKILQDESVDDKTTAMKASVNQFLDFLDNLEKGDITMKEDKTQNGQTANAAGEDVQKNQQQGAETTQAQENGQPQELLQKLNDVLEKISGLENRLAELEKAHPGRQSEEGRDEDVEKNEKGYKGLRII